MSAKMMTTKQQREYDRKVSALKLALETADSPNADSLSRSYNLPKETVEYEIRRINHGS